MTLLTLNLLLMGAVFTLAGGIQYRFPPKKINHFYGYRTPASKRSQAAWDFAQIYSARLMLRLGLGLLCFGMAAEILAIETDFDLALGMGLPLVCVLLIIIHVERTLRDRFPRPPKKQ